MATTKWAKADNLSPVIIIGLNTFRGVGLFMIDA